MRQAASGCMVPRARPLSVAGASRCCGAAFSAASLAFGSPPVPAASGIDDSAPCAEPHPIHHQHPALARLPRSEAPPVAAVVHAVAALSARLQPLYAAWELLQRKWEALLEV